MPAHEGAGPVAYVSLYRKYRPQTFSDVVGQKHVITSLQNAIREDSLGHAYLFAGPRGTGKTTIARILAMAVNATGGPSPDPDPEDPVSIAIRKGQSMDVIELDMASHGGVDDARDLRDRAIYAPTELRKKVYILDEVHMASSAAFNALLKLIEEPPDHVIFAMATTDPQKVLPTILSRVQRLDLRRVGTADLGAHLRRLGGLEGFTIDDAALAQVLRAGEGSVRDTLSVLEQVVAFAGGGGGAAAEVTEEHAAAVLGRTPVLRTLQAVEHLATQNVGGAFTLVQDLIDDGHDLRRFTLDLVQHLRDLLVMQAVPDRPDLVDAAEDHRLVLAEQASRVSRDRLVHAVDVLGAILVEQRTGPPRLPLELALARLAVPESSGDLVALVDRLAQLEARVAGTATAPVATVTSAAVPPVASPPSTTPAAAPPEPAPPASPPVAAPAQPAAPVAAPAQPAAPVAAPAAPGSAAAGPAAAGPAEATVPSLEIVVQRWDAVLEVVKVARRKAHSMYEPATPVRLSRGVLVLDYPPKYAGFHREQAMAGELIKVLQDALVEVCGFKVAIEAVADGAVDRRPSHPDVTPPDARTAVDPITGGDPERGAVAGASDPGASRADAVDPDANPFDRDEPPPFVDGAQPAAGQVTAPTATSTPIVPAASAAVPVPAEPHDEQSLVLEAEHTGNPGAPDMDTAVATLVEVLDAVEVVEAEIG